MNYDPVIHDDLIEIYMENLEVWCEGCGEVVATFGNEMKYKRLREAIAHHFNNKEHK